MTSAHAGRWAMAPFLDVNSIQCCCRVRCSTGREDVKFNFKLLQFLDIRRAVVTLTNKVGLGPEPEVEELPELAGTATSAVQSRVSRFARLQLDLHKEHNVRSWLAVVNAANGGPPVPETAVPLRCGFRVTISNADTVYDSGRSYWINALRRYKRLIPPPAPYETQKAVEVLGYVPPRQLPGFHEGAVPTLMFALTTMASNFGVISPFRLPPGQVDEISAGRTARLCTSVCECRYVRLPPYLLDCVSSVAA